MSWRQRPGPWIFLILLGSYAFYWQSRDWNTATRLMLTYAIVDRGTIVIDGLEDQTHDRASFGGHFYTDKLPGFSFLAIPAYAASRSAFGLPPHPLGAKGFAHWPADYWVTLGTSGLLSALTGVLLGRLAMDLGCSPRRAALVAIAYGLATPAYTYATLSYGHQATAFALLAAFALLWRAEETGSRWRLTVAGFLAAAASVIELQVGPVSAILGLYLLGQVACGVRKPRDIVSFALGAAGPTLALLAYNQAAFGSPLDMGYFHHDTKIFADVHSKENPLGLGIPGATTALALLWGRHRGLLFYAPIVALVPLGLAALAFRRQWGVLVVATSVIAAVFLVNVSYPEWTGGWSTGPRLLVPLLPFAMLAVAALIGRGDRASWLSALVLSLAGWVLISSLVGVGGRIPQFFQDPITQVVLPLWQGERLPGWTGERFARTILDRSAITAADFRSPWEGVTRFGPLWAFQAVGMALALTFLSGSPRPLASVGAGTGRGRLDLRVDQKQDGGRQDQEPEDPERQPGGVAPDPPPVLMP